MKRARFAMKKQTRKKQLCLLLSLAIVPGMMPLLSEEVSATGSTVLNTTGKIETGVYHLEEDLYGNFQVSGEVTIDLNGHNLIGNGSGSVLTVYGNSTLTLKDSDPENRVRYGHWEFGPEEKDVYVFSDTPELEVVDETIYGGCITGGDMLPDNEEDGSQTLTLGGGIFNTGSLDMYENTVITSNEAYGRIKDRGDGGGVCNVGTRNYWGNGSWAEFNLYDGNICGNQTGGTDADGAGVKNRNGTVKMKNGNISHNTALSQGGGVKNSSGTFNMSGGNISENRALGGYAGGVSCLGDFYMSGGSISNNTACLEDFESEGGGIWCKGRFVMSGGSITGNTAFRGAGVLQFYGTEIYGSPWIYGNKNQNGEEDNVFVEDDRYPVLITNSLDQEAYIGVTTYQDPKDGDASFAVGHDYRIQESDMERFQSDKGYKIILDSENGTLKLKKSEEPGWVKDGEDWSYRTADGNLLVKQWLHLENSWAYFDENAHMVTGWQKIGNNWFYFYSSGRMVTGTQVIGGKTYHFANSGALL